MTAAAHLDGRGRNLSATLSAGRSHHLGETSFQDLSGLLSTGDPPTIRDPDEPYLSQLSTLRYGIMLAAGQLFIERPITDDACIRVLPEDYSDVILSLLSLEETPTLIVPIDLDSDHGSTPPLMGEMRTQFSSRS